MGSIWTSLAIGLSLIIKLVAQVASPTNRVEQPTYRASTILAVWLVEPKASPELKCLVSLPWGKLQMIANMFSPVTGPPSSACTLIAVSSANHMVIHTDLENYQQGTFDVKASTWHH